MYIRASIDWALDSLTNYLGPVNDVGALIRPMAMLVDFDF
jgi:hypothetical protein